MAATSEHRTTAVRRPSKGFTFIELLATVVLIAVIMPVTMGRISLCTSLAGQSRRQIEAATLAKAKLTELVVGRDWETGDKSGDFGKDWPDYRWIAEVAEWTDPTLRRLDLTVFWQSRNRQQSITLSTLVYPQTQ